jgi:type IV secretion system protein VirB6
MATYCTAAASEHFATQLLADTDCQAFGLVERGYAALAQPGGTVSTALTGMLVIAVAIYGYRLLLGRGLALGDALGLTVRIGVVLLIATSWESWQALAYHGLAQAPGEVSSNILVAIGAPAPLDSLQHALDDLTAAAVGYRSRAGIASPLVGGPAAAAAVLNLSSLFLTLSTVGVLVAARVVQAVLLAIAPAMAGLLLFNATRGMAQGWLGAIAAAALAPLFVLLIAAIEFAVLAPMIARLLTQQAAGIFENSEVMPIGLVTVVFILAIGLGLRTVARIGYGLRLADRIGRTAAAAVATNAERTIAATRPAPALAAPSVQRLVQSLETIARRDAGGGSARGAATSLGSSRAAVATRDASGSGRATPGSVTTEYPISPRAPRLRSAARRSRAAARRDL